MLKNAYLGAKIGFDTAANEHSLRFASANELSKVCPLSVYRSPRSKLQKLQKLPKLQKSQKY